MKHVMWHFESHWVACPRHGHVNLRYCIRTQSLLVQRLGALLFLLLFLLLLLLLLLDVLLFLLLLVLHVLLLLDVLLW